MIYASSFSQSGQTNRISHLLAPHYFLMVGIVGKMADKESEMSTEYLVNSWNKDDGQLEVLRLHYLLDSKPDRE